MALRFLFSLQSDEFLSRRHVIGEQQRLFDEVDAGDTLQHSVHLAGLDRATEGPAVTLRTSGHGVVVPIERIQREPLHLRWCCAQPGAQSAHDGDAVVARHLHDHTYADDAPLFQCFRDPLERFVARSHLRDRDAARPIGALRNTRDDKDSHCAGLGGSSVSAPNARHIGRSFAGEVFEVRASDGTVASPEHQRPAFLGVVE